MRSTRVEREDESAEKRLLNGTRFSIPTARYAKRIIIIIHRRRIDGIQMLRHEPRLHLTRRHRTT